MSILSFRRILVIGVAPMVVACNPADKPYNKGAPSQQTNVAIHEVLGVELSADTLKDGIQFYDQKLPAYLESVKGLAAPESFGRWSVAKLVILDFKGSLPGEFDLDMVLGGFGPNIGADLQVIVGAESKQIKIKGDILHMQTYTLHFSNPQKASSIALIIPLPSSPQALGKAANDPRMLGIALQSLLVKPILKPAPVNNLSSL